METIFNKKDVNFTSINELINGAMLMALPKTNEKNNEKLRNNIQKLAQNLRLLLNEPEITQEKNTKSVLPILPEIQIEKPQIQPQKLSPSKIRAPVYFFVLIKKSLNFFSKRPLAQMHSNSPKEIQTSPTTKRIRKKYGSSWLPGGKFFYQIFLKAYGWG